MMRLLTRCSVLVSILGFTYSLASALSASVSAAQTMDRRSAIAAAISTPFLLASDSASCSPLDASTSQPPPASSSPPNPAGILDPNPRAITTIRIESPRQSVGLELYRVTIGTPPRSVAAVRSVRPGEIAARAGARRGMILLDYADAEGLAKRIAAASGAHPFELRLYDLAMGGDAVGDLGRGIVTPEDALELAQKASGGVDVSDAVSLDRKEGRAAVDEGFVIDTIREASGECAVKSRRGDTMQIRYTARIGDRNGAIYDASEYRGTGQPYAYVLGNNDVLKGVDLGTYDMCPGEVRGLSIPPELGYRGGSRLYRQIPPNSRLFWEVELVELNFVKEGRNDISREEREGRD